MNIISRTRRGVVMRARSAFTSVELLVVIALIAILGALIMAGVQSVRGKEMLSTTQIDIRKMTAALENFKTRYGVYPPSEVTVGADENTIKTSHAPSHRILTRIWPALNFGKAFGAEGMAVTGTVTLKGDQCLVLFLGGRHDASGCHGFSTSKANPLSADADREQPLFNFKGNRLHNRGTAGPFFSYGDGWFGNAYQGEAIKTAYAYFSPSTGAYSDTHCNNLADKKGNFPKPFKDSAGKYLNRQSYQILSSGQDLLWGTAQQWSSGAAVTDGESTDNVANFASGLLSGS